MSGINPAGGGNPTELLEEFGILNQQKAHLSDVRGGIDRLFRPVRNLLENGQSDFSEALRSRVRTFYHFANSVWTNPINNHPSSDASGFSKLMGEVTSISNDLFTFVGNSGTDLSSDLKGRLEELWPADALRATADTYLPERVENKIKRRLAEVEGLLKQALKSGQGGGGALLGIGFLVVMGALAVSELSSVPSRSPSYGAGVLVG